MGLGEVASPPISAPELLSGRHELTAFASGEAVLDDWLCRRERANQVSGASRSYVLCQGPTVIGYYSLASGAIVIAWQAVAARRHPADPAGRFR